MRTRQRGMMHSGIEPHPHSSHLLARILRACLGLMILLATGMPASAGSIEVSRNWLWNDKASATFPLASTDVRGFIDNGVIQDPANAVGGTYRPWNNVNVSIFKGGSSSDVTVTEMPNSGTKTIDVKVRSATFDGKALAGAKDPFIFAPVSFDRFLTLNAPILLMDFQTGAGEGVMDTQSASVMLGSTLMPIYSMTITSRNGGSPSVSLQVDPAASSQGWDQVSLTSSLQASFAPTTTPGEFISSGFTFPELTFFLPANESGTLFTLDQVETVAPEPASLTLLSLGALGALGSCWRRRKRIA
jgi:hypothetical protein